MINFETIPLFVALLILQGCAITESIDRKLSPQLYKDNTTVNCNGLTRHELNYGIKNPSYMTF